MMTPKQKTERQAILTVAYHSYVRGLNARAFFKLNNRETGESLVQDTFMKTWMYLVKGGKIDLMKAFLYHILNNLIIDEYRKHKTVSLDTLIEKGFEPREIIPEVTFDVFDTKVVLFLINHLPDSYKKVIHMRYIQDLSIKEISLITGQSKNTVAVQLHRGLRKLKILYNNKEK
ncbi:MAG: RNA polymerase sigma factor [Candidatus Pacebacteria bacterium]|nr:RNA polymerase sigma factor [Candidatus Paceibacterota bacterium]